MNAPLAVRQEFGGQQQTFAVAETASTAVAAQAKAMIEARYIMAMQRPRDWDNVRQKLIKECRRPSFANNKSAFYRKPIGQGVEGLGIRFVEVALRCMTNVLVETTMIFEDDMKEVHRVSVTDLESNLTYPLDVRVSKTVERSKPMDDGSYISVRTNSYKKLVYTVPANDDDLLNKRGALISKAMRTLGLRIIPGDMQDEAEDIIKAVRLDQAARDPDAERKRIADAFAGIGIKVTELVAYLGHPLDSCSPHELVELRGIYGAIRDGEATWKNVMENKAEQGSDAGTDAIPAELKAKAEAAAKLGTKAYGEFFQKLTPAERKQLQAYRETADKLAAAADKAAKPADSDQTGQPASTSTAVSKEMEGLVADLEAVASDGIEAFVSMWDGLSKATKDKLGNDEYKRLKALAEGSGK